MLIVTHPFILEIVRIKNARHSYGSETLFNLISTVGVMREGVRETSFTFNRWVPVWHLSTVFTCPTSRR